MKKTEKELQVLHKEFQMILDRFIAYLKTQNKLNTADDLLPEMSYTYMDCHNKIDTTRCILWRGNALLKSGCDAQINVELQRFAKPEAGIALEIFAHKTGLPLTEGWVKE